MKPARPVRTSAPESSDARTALLDAAERLMLDEGYAAVSSRRLASRAGLDPGLIYYYFGTMDDLFIALFRRGAERSLERQAQALSSEQPLWGLWDMAHDPSDTALSGEFVALANHRKAIRAEIAAYSKKFRRMQLEMVTRVFESHRIDDESWPPAFVLLLLTSISRQLRIEETFGIDIGHAKTIAFIERRIRGLEGERTPRATRRGATRVRARRMGRRS